MSLRQSKDKFDGQEIVLYSKSLGEGTDARSSRTVTQLAENGKQIVHRQYVPGEGGAERLMMELVITRKSDAPPGDK
jgi:hypothetical protein